MDNILALEEDVTEDAEADALVGLDTTEAGAVTDRRVVDVLARNGLLDAADGDGEIGRGGSAGEDVTTLSSAVLRAADLGIVGTNDGRVGVDESGTRVEDTGDGGLGGSSTNAVGRCAKAPEALAVVGINVGDRTSVLALVDEAKVVGTGSMVLQVDSEQRLSKLGLDSVEECGLLNGRNGVDGAHCEAEKTVRVGVLGKSGRDRGSSLYSLGSSCDCTDLDLVGVDLAGCTRSVTVGDPPAVTALDLGLIDSVVVVTSELRPSLQGGKHPEIRASSIEIEVNGSAANGNWAQV